MALRERDLLARESAVLSRERAVLMRENSVRAGAEALKQERINWNERLDDSRLEERENERPREGSHSSNSATEDDVIARVASRPSMVPRRPLEERRMS